MIANSKLETQKNKTSSSAWIGLAWGAFVGATPFFQSIGLVAQLTLGLGLFLTYLSVGLLLKIIPFPSFVQTNTTKFLWGALFGVLYSLPGAIFTMTPYPLADDAPAYFREFAAGGIRAFTLTLVFGAVVGATCLLGRRAFNNSDH